MTVLYLTALIVTAAAVIPAASRDEGFLGRHEIRRVLCDTKVCHERAQIILDSINQSADPCEDFYGYVCARWADAHPIPEGLQNYDVFHVIEESVQRDIKELLETMKNVTHARNLTEKLGVAYHTCMRDASEMSKEKGSRILRKLLDEEGLGLWPLVGNATQSPFKDFADVLRTTSLTSLFSVHVVKDNANASAKIVQLQQSTAPLDGAEHVRNPSDILRWGSKRIMQLASMFRPDATDGDLQSFARSVLKFKRGLENLVQPLEERRNVTQNITKGAIKGAESRLPGLPLLELLNQEMRPANVTLRDTDKIAVVALNYIVRTLEFVKRFEPVVFYNFIGVVKALEISKRVWIPHGEPLDVPRPTNKSRSTGDGGDQASSACITMLREATKELTGRLYMEHKFPFEAKAELWTLKPYIGYSGFSLEEAAMNKHFDQVGDIGYKDSFAEIFVKFQKNSIIKSYASLREEGPLWIPYGGDDVNAFNLPSTNEITISAGLLQNVLFQPGLPSYINLGAIGSVMGHEITHGYDDKGSEYDARGHLVDWWTEHTRKEFFRKLDCFRIQYGSIVDRATNLKLNADTTIGENIADNAGVRVAYAAHQDASLDFQEVTLPGLENFTSDQLFFVSYALVWCENALPSWNAQKIKTQVHPPNKYRVNVPLKNLEQFTAAFMCKKGSEMRLPDADRCVLW
ncbi:membrane metallo-endopeptidase-like 1 isoform X2 [Dermacentor albipictus]|uniref:membrane metallo-endopeptidase-like 1 isoform X2 n=1 Tax=Dermacentor albipictus TaxID=60249 RepID=UPI0031FCC204